MSDLSVYKPSVSITQVFEVNEALPDSELTFDLWKKLIQAKTIQDTTFIAIGHMLKIIRDRKLYKFLDFDNFSQFLASSELSFSREKSYLYIRTYELYIEHLGLNEKEVSDIGVARLMMLAPQVREIHNKEDAKKRVEEMSSLRYGDFIKEMKKDNDDADKPTVFFSEEFNKWQVKYYDNKTDLHSLGDYEG